MNDNARRLVQELRSGKWEQGASWLRVGDAFCCLGVACELAVEAGVIPSAVRYGDGPDGTYDYNGQSSHLPNEVRVWLGLKTECGTYGADGEYSLVELNDGGATFAEIADLIESEPEGLFVE